MKRFIERRPTAAHVTSRMLDDCIGEDNPVRVVVALVEDLDLQALGFEGAEGRPTLVSVLSKLYVYVHLNKRFVGKYRELKPFSHTIVAVGGSKIKAANSRDCNFTAGKIDTRQRLIEESIQGYIYDIETADRTQHDGVEPKTKRLAAKFRELCEQM